VQATLARLTLDADAVVTILTGLDERQRERRPWRRSFTAGWTGAARTVSGVRWLMGLLDEAVQTARASRDLLLFRKTLHTLEGVVADVGAGEGQIDDVLLGEFLRHLVVEWPQRWLTPLGSRAFATRLSNADLAGFLLNLPLAVPRFWLDPCWLRS
jgi:hypothetical protein